MKLNIVLCSLLALTTWSCSKKDADKVVDCFGQSLLVDVHHSPVSGEPSRINYSVKYVGEHELNTVIKWNYGDGTPVQNVTGTTSSHTYAKAGTYTAIATVSLDGASCSFDIKETVTIP
ncbi:PKD domain-containing protein [Sphingobacterium psychroaquaticum]|uniref:PKD domain-containing protein n=1 Tax=Sphingobacterium psychroaquaticum TaxID=561061 RepID=A0A1X7IP61_9SPHI|nr:PKD domain-containing protein [Sphingobacterium psychroaquaticum]QBQ41338.1 PKD domain-containing protein [Sphingobacterium psychroaquaticum]SMG16514.1 PKD domain-containing protein [Sphingobacterium psychroaquaticum]